MSLGYLESGESLLKIRAKDRVVNQKGDLERSIEGGVKARRVEGIRTIEQLSASIFEEQKGIVKPNWILPIRPQQIAANVLVVAPEVPSYVDERCEKCFT